MTAQHPDDPHQLASAAVVVGVDGSAGSDTAVGWAADYAAARQRALRLVHGLDLVGMSAVLGSYDVLIPPVIEAVREGGRVLLDRAAAIARQRDPNLTVTVALTAQSPAALLIEESAHAYATVLGATGTAGSIAHLGSTLLAVTAHAHGAVVVVRPDPDADNAIHDSGPVVVGVDGGPVGEAAIAAAFREAAERGAELVAVHTWSDWSFGDFAGGDRLTVPESELEHREWAILAERLAGWQEKYPEVRVTRRVYPWAPADQLRTWSRTAQLVVVGNRGRGGFPGLLLGSTTNALVQHAHCPVLVVHPADR
ncbi:universal stress protein [Nocardia otitidiscaviarum]|uniref:Universal stress protein n=1 Tax=Nocardia otitidiscaviarum TaxID=1823 RepID=A0A516NLL9_9NOCA|nr:universal stress protein [Nocardia otitidiscaviarum]MCP9618736.1 universal stress protein [Nocardia otitidiscaviarum]QDP79804.1 universal stress protein [Nocardia otitidiscaviarum]